MKLGLFSANMYACSHPEGIARVARLAEDAGFESLWAGEHVVLPDPQVPPSPMAPKDRALDPIVALTYAAANCTRLRLGTGIIILPQRNPVVLAKELASLDVLSSGRLEFGIGVGYLEPEFRAVGVPFADRAARTADYLGAIESLWYDEHPAFDGRYVEFSGVDAHPRPVQRRIPVVIGGHSAPAYQRAIKRGDGWYGFALSVDHAAASLEGLRAAAERSPRPEHLGRLQISITPRGRLTAEQVEAYGRLGVDRLIPMPIPGGDLGAVEKTISDAVTAVSDAGLALD